MFLIYSDVEAQYIAYDLRIGAPDYAMIGSGEARLAWYGGAAAT